MGRELQEPSAGAVTAWRDQFTVSRAEPTSPGQTARVECCETGKPAFLSGIAKADEGDGALPLKTVKTTNVTLKADSVTLV